MKTILEETGGFTPVIDALIPEFGLVGSAIFGRVWRYCQGQRRVCQASITTIGDGLGVTRRTVHRHLAKLCEAGYLEDTTPGLRNRPHTYRDTGKLMLIVEVAVQESHTDDGEGVQDLHSGVQELPTDCALESHEDSREDTSKIDSTKSKVEKPRKGTPRAVSVFRSVTRLYPAKAWYGDVDRIVGRDPPDLERWKQTVKAWVGMGWNPQNVQGMLECYERGEIPGKKNGGGAVQTIDGKKVITVPIR